MKKIVKKLETALYVCASVSLIIYYFFPINILTWIFSAGMTLFIFKALKEAA